MRLGLLESSELVFLRDDVVASKHGVGFVTRNAHSHGLRDTGPGCQRMDPRPNKRVQRTRSATLRSAASRLVSLGLAALIAIAGTGCVHMAAPPPLAIFGGPLTVGPGRSELGIGAGTGGSLFPGAHAGGTGGSPAGVRV
jgi:hypothetical protein